MAQRLVLQQVTFTSYSFRFMRLLKNFILFTKEKKKLMPLNRSFLLMKIVASKLIAGQIFAQVQSFMTKKTLPGNIMEMMIQQMLDITSLL